jgi:tetratricopeptide (TPR) repeat protein
VSIRSSVQPGGPLRAGGSPPQQKRLEEAETFYKRALEVNPRYGKALFNLGTLYESRGDLKQALEKYKAADEAGLPQGREQYLRLRSTLKQ